MTLSDDQVKSTLKLITQAVSQGIKDKLEDYDQEKFTETTNHRRNIKGDFINTRLGKKVENSTILYLAGFKRSSWEGRLVVDSKNKITYTIVTLANFGSIKRKSRTKSTHYLNLMQIVQNRKIRIQLDENRLFPPDYHELDLIETEIYAEYEKAVGALMLSDFLNIVVVYAYKKDKLTTLKAMLLTPKFEVYQEWGMLDFVKPDFGDLTNIEKEGLERKSIKPIVKIKENKILERKGKRPIVGIRTEVTEKQQ